MYPPRTSSVLNLTSRARWAAFCKGSPKWQLSVAHPGRFHPCKWASWPWTPLLSQPTLTSQIMLMNYSRASRRCVPVDHLSSMARPSQPTPRGSKADRTMPSRSVIETVWSYFNVFINITSQFLSKWGCFAERCWNGVLILPYILPNVLHLKSTVRSRKSFQNMDRSNYIIL